MTDRDALLALADRVEACTGPDREIDNAIWDAVYRGPPLECHCTGACNPISPNYLGACVVVPHYTASIDAAMTLVPEGRDWMIDNFDGPHDRRCSASVFNAKGQDYADYEAFAATPAPALCAASLRALAGERG